MKRLPPISTLFPYTTLFRSLSCSGPVGSNPLDCRPNRPRRRSAEDRKSTRLNSSHVKISYAVFCLKKKKYGSKTSYAADNHPLLFMHSTLCASRYVFYGTYK